MVGSHACGIFTLKILENIRIQMHVGMLKYGWLNRKVHTSKESNTIPDENVNTWNLSICLAHDHRKKNKVSPKRFTSEQSFKIGIFVSLGSISCTMDYKSMWRFPKIVVPPNHPF